MQPRHVIPQVRPVSRIVVCLSMKTKGMQPGTTTLSASARHLATSVTATEEDDTAQKLACIWQQQLGVAAVDLKQNFFDLGGDSSLAVRMFAEIEKVFGVKLPLATLYEAPTVEELARILRGEVASSGCSALVSIQPSGSRPPFFCMHGAGGTVLMYRELSRHLGDDQPFYGLQSLGLDGSCAPLTSIEEMGSVYLKEIRKAQPRGPYFIGGYCMGGTVAFEVAQQLQREGETIALLAMFDTMNWHKIPLTIRSKTSHASQRVVFHASSFLSLDSRGKVRFFREKVGALRSRIPVWRGKLLARFNKGVRGEVSDSLLLAQIWQQNDRASWNYIPKPFPGVVTDIRPAKQYRVFSKPDLKWERLTEGHEIVVLPVNPASMLVEPFVEHLAAALRQSIDAAAQRFNVDSSR
jgi:phthiocerol/phenolphthiocerol synthesis type-I polyketide synthase E